MKDVIDVMQLQREKARRIPVIDYRQKQNHFIAIRYIFECGTKLEAKPLTIATASVLYHRFFREADSNNYDCYLLAATSLYLAGKVEDDPLKVRDVINVTHNTLHRGSPPLELGDEYWNMRDAIVQAELLVMRMLKFEVSCTHPHKYLLHFLKTLEDWFDPSEWKNLPISKAAASFLQVTQNASELRNLEFKFYLPSSSYDNSIVDDCLAMSNGGEGNLLLLDCAAQAFLADEDFHHDPIILELKPQHVAVACINLALQCYGAQVPLVDEENSFTWYSVFAEDLSKDALWDIMEKIMDVYNREHEFV